MKESNKRQICQSGPVLEESNSSPWVSVFGNRFTEVDIAGVAGVLKSHLVGAGAKTVEFERRFRERIGFKHAVATNSATSAFWLLIRALGFGADDEVILPNIHFHGLATTLDLLGVPYAICDVSPSVPNLMVENVQGRINKKTRAIIFLDYGGFPAPGREVKHYLAGIGRKDVKLILDAANSQFTKVDGAYAARQHDFAFYSFDMNKILVTGDGGMVLSDDREVIERVRSLAYYGIKERHKSGFDKARHGATRWWKFTVEEPSLNMVMNNIAASLGLTQLDQVDEWLGKRKHLKEFYLNRFVPLAARGLLSLPRASVNVENDLFFFWVKAPTEAVRDGLAKFLLKKGIYTTVKYQPLDASADTPNAHDFWRRALCLPFHQNIEPVVAEAIVSRVYEYLQKDRVEK